MMVRYLRMTMLGVTLVAMVAGTALAQLPQPTSGPNTDRPATEAAPPTIGIIEGTIEKVDASARTVSVSSGLFGLFRTMLEIGRDTQINVYGRDATLSKLHEGSRVKASYETRNGRRVATRIAVI